MSPNITSRFIRLVSSITRASPGSCGYNRTTEKEQSTASVKAFSSTTFSGGKKYIGQKILGGVGMLKTFSQLLASVLHR